MRICRAALLLRRADHLLITLASVMPPTASLAPDEAQLPSRQPRQVYLRGLLRSRADTRTLRISIRPSSALRLEALLVVALPRCKASQQSHPLVSPCLPQELQGRLRCRLDSCHLRASSLRQALDVDETGPVFLFDTSLHHTWFN